MKSKINMILLGVLSVCVIGLLALILTYFVMAGKYKKKQALASAQTAASQTETQAQPAETSDTQVSPEPAPEEEVPSSADNSSLIYKVPGKNTTASSSAADPNAVQAAAPAVDTTTKLYLLFDETPVFVQPEGAEKPVVDYPDLTLSGLFTGRECADSNYREIDYRDRKALVPAKSVTEMSGSVILPVGVIAQVTDGIGYSACAPACLYMMHKTAGLQPKNVSAASYDGLLRLAEEYGYADQGSLYSLGGGMTADALIRFAKDMYGADLVNMYSNDKKPADVIKEIIDSGKQAIVLVHQEHGEVVDSGDKAHFVLFTGYTETDGAIEFIFANSYEEVNYNLGLPLQKASSELVNISAGSQFEGEPNAILCLK